MLRFRCPMSAYLACSTDQHFSAYSPIDSIPLQLQRKLENRWQQFKKYKKKATAEKLLLFCHSGWIKHTHCCLCTVILIKETIWHTNFHFFCVRVCVCWCRWRIANLFPCPFRLPHTQYLYSFASFDYSLNRWFNLQKLLSIVQHFIYHLGRCVAKISSNLIVLFTFYIEIL